MSKNVESVRISFEVDRMEGLDPADSGRLMRSAGQMLRVERRSSCARAAGCIIESLCSDGRFVHVACEPSRSHATYDSPEEISLVGCAQSEVSAADTKKVFLFVARHLRNEETEE